MNTKRIVTTALLLAMCLIFQSMKGFSIYLTGSAVNAILIIATLSLGIWSGSFISIITPIIAYILGQTPVMQLMPIMVIVVMLGNLTLVLITNMSKKSNLAIFLGLGSVFKAIVLWLLVWYAVLPIFGANVPEKMVSVIKTTFSITQLITALIGSVIAYIVYNRVKKQIV